MKKNGFTLAEILITLGIIGVVAALTTPALIQNTGSAQVGPKLAKAVATFENANQNMLTNLGVDRITSAGVSELRKEKALQWFNQVTGESSHDTYNSGFDESAYTNALTNYMKMNYLGGRDYSGYSTTSETHKVTTYDGSTYNLQAVFAFIPSISNMFMSALFPPAYAFQVSQSVGQVKWEADPAVQISDKVLGQVHSLVDELDGVAPGDALDLGQKYLSKDGTLYTIKITGSVSNGNMVLNNNTAPHAQIVGYVHIDINGLSAPNQLARDIFVFTLFNDGSLQPLGGRGSGVSADKYWDNTCNANQVTDGGLYCAGSIFENNLKVIYQ